MLWRTCALLTLFTLVACAGLGPTTEPGWQGSVAAAIPHEDGTADFSSAAEWFPDAQGFVHERSISIGPPNFRQGVFALTPTSLLFMQWDPPENKYNVMYRATYTEIASVRADAFGRNRRLVVVGKDYRTQTFGISGPKGALVDLKATQQAADMLAARIPTH
jgi:hypothetical protein